MPSSPVEFLSDRSVQFQGQAWAAWILRRFGWTVVYRGLPSRQGLFVVYPHTSNWDFVVGILVKWSLGLPANFWAKHSLFQWPLLGAWMQRMGGIAIDRRSSQGVVAQTVQAFEAARREDRFLWLALAPEGTRSRVTQWRSGFYRLALGAQLPVALVGLDPARKRVHIDTFVRFSGDLEADIRASQDALAGFQGFKPQLAGPVVWQAPSPSSEPQLPS